MSGTRQAIGEHIAGQITRVEDGVLAAQVEAFAEIRDERDHARNVAALLESTLTTVARVVDEALTRGSDPHTALLRIRCLAGNGHHWQSIVRDGLHRWFQCTECGEQK